MYKIVLKDARALLAAAAMMIVGTLLSSMIFLHFSDDFGLARARWWWEIMMNLQALSCAFVWFCYADRLRDGKGNPRYVMRVRMWAALVLVLTPAWIILFSAYKNWFVERPELSDLNPIFIIVVCAWIISILVPRGLYLMQRVDTKFSLWELVKPTRIFWVMVTTVFLTLAGAVYFIDIRAAYIISPFLLFLVTSSGYIAAGMGVERKAKVK